MSNSSFEKLESLSIDNNASTTGVTKKQITDLGNKIIKTDSNEESGLEIYCYSKYETNDEDATTLQKCRGVIFKGDELIVNAYPHTEEIDIRDEENARNILDNIDLENSTIYYSYEGCLLRLYCIDDTWYLSTHRKIDAFKSKWSSYVSFGEEFVKGLENEYKNNPEFKESIGETENVFETFKDSLNKNMQYVFLVLNNKENRIVCINKEESNIYHVGTFIDGKLDHEHDARIKKPEEVLKDDKSPESIINFTKEVEPSNHQGIIVFTNDKLYKFIHGDYSYLFGVRGNSPSIKFRYLQLRMNKDMRESLEYLYPSEVENFEEYENILYLIAKRIYNSYINKFIKKSKDTIPKQEYYIVKLCHNNYLADRDNNKISLEIVINILNNQKPTFLNQLIKSHKLQKKKEEYEKRKEHGDEKTE